MNKAIIMALALFLLCSVAAFAAGTQDSGSTSATMSGSGEKTAIQEYKPDFVFPSEPVKITYWDYFDERPNRIKLEKEIAKEYEAIHPNVKIEVVNIPWVGYKAKYETAFVAGTQPDLITWFPGTTSPKGYTHPAPEWAEKYVRDNFSKNAILKCEYDGKIWGWAGNIDVGQMIYYNTDMYNEAGVGEPESLTLPEYVEIMKKTTKYDSNKDIIQGGYGIRYFGERGGIWDKFRKFGYAFVDDGGGFTWNMDYTDVIFDSAEHIEALDFFRKMVFDWKVASVKFPKPSEAFKLGLAASTYRESWMYADLDQTAPDLNYKIIPVANGAAPLGKYEVGQGFSASHVTQVSTTRPELIDLAWDVSLFFTTQENDLKIAEIQGSLPHRTENMDTDYVRGLPYGATAQVMMLEREPSRIESEPYGINSEIQYFGGEAVELVLTGQKDAATAAKEAAEKAREVIKKARNQ